MAEARRPHVPTPGDVPPHLTANVRSYQVPRGFTDAVALGQVSTFRLEATVIPEPAPFALLTGALATPRPLSRGARRRPTPAKS